VAQKQYNPNTISEKHTLTTDKTASSQLFPLADLQCKNRQDRRGFCAQPWLALSDRPSIRVRRKRTLDEKGGAYSAAVQVARGVYVYQTSKNGVALQLTLQGTKYYKDDDLNKPVAQREATTIMWCTGDL
jgi:hypothetical protein